MFLNEIKKTGTNAQAFQNGLGEHLG